MVSEAYMYVSGCSETWTAIASILFSWELLSRKRKQGQRGLHAVHDFLIAEG